MAATKRTRHQREKDLAELSQLEAEGWSHQQLAAHFKLTKQQIGYDLAELDVRFQAEQLANTERRKRRRNNELERIKARAREGFQRSQKDAETLHVESISSGRVDQEGKPQPDSMKQTKTVKGQAGDSSFLAVERQALADQVKLWGDAAPEKVAPTNPEGTDEYSGGGTGPLLAALLRAAAEAGAADGAAVLEGDVPKPL